MCLLLVIACLALSRFSPAQQQDQQDQQQQDQQQQDQQQQGQQPAQELSADEIIQILQQDPNLLAEAKTEIAQQLQDRGYAVTVNEITDDRLFTEIRSDDRVRQAMSDALEQQGYGPEQTSAQGQRGPSPQAQPSPLSRQQGRMARGEMGNGAAKQRGQREQMQEGKAGRPEQGQYPLRNLPALRDLYKQAVNPPEKLERFGAALFRNSVATAEKSGNKAPADVPASSDYIIGPGDQLVVEYWGRSTQRLQLTVDREGRIILPEAGGLVVAGRTLSEAQDMIQKLLARQFRDITVDVTLGKLRNIRVYVVGDVKNPGAYDISSLSTPLSALIAAGGPTDTGSYRLVKHFRGKKLVEEVDLYDLMLKGVTTAQAHLESGDSILVPPAGPQVTVAGAVRRPAIYELHNEETLDQVLDLAGGVPVSGALSTIKLERIVAHERREMLSLNLPAGDPPSDDAFKRVEIKDGDTITVSPILPYSNQTVYLEGHVFRPGKYPFRNGLKVTDIISSFDDLLPESADRAEIVRLHPPDMNPLVIGFNLREVLEKKAPPPSLQPFDTIRVFGRYEADAPKVSIYGEVLRPGEYPLSEHMTAAELLRLAGGFKRSAYRDSADLSSYSIVNGEKVEFDHREIPIERALRGEPDTDVLLKPGDVLTIRQIGGWVDIGGAITVAGEVLHPGRYGIENGERLSSIIKRAGGFQDDAYPYAAILDRAQVRELSAKSRNEMISTLRQQSGGGPRPAFFSSTSRQNQQLIDKLQEIPPSGRVVIHISADISKWEGTGADVEVRPGDSLLIPKRPNFVMVAGQVYNPTAITYSQGKHAGWYLRQAGGPTSVGNKKDVFVIRANGTVVGRGSGRWWSGNVMSTILQPGDTIYVPDKVGGSALFRNLGQTVQILSGVAVAVGVIRTF
ncbi:MAG TPA: SLBB domain-containing protein [Candidatus Angelobacter sp.]|nr:SLBB domain-containing protein [Candidatus Angelobacter sp.]